MFSRDRKRMETTTGPLSPLPEPPVIRQMQQQITEWEATSDGKALFLRCYRLMTGNILGAIERDEFLDSRWVNALAHHFAAYYFNALTAYDASPASAPGVWQLAHDAAAQNDVSALAKLLLGINAHINVDLVLTLVDLLESEWPSLTEDQCSARYADHCRVNAVIARTIDAVQDDIIAPAMPGMELVDELMGPIDEFLVSRLIAHWRERVWENATRLLSLPSSSERAAVVRAIEADALRLGRLMHRL